MKLYERIRRFDPEAVTSRKGGQAECPARDAGLRTEDVEAIWRSVVRLYGTGLYPAVALCLRRKNHVVIDRAIGHARGNAPGALRGSEKHQATPDTLYCLFSASKMVTAMLIHLLDQRGRIHLDDPIVHYIPEFAQHGKQWVTIRHVLTHRAGIPTIATDLSDLALLQQPSRIVEMICEQEPVSPPGRRLAYHALTGGYVLGEVILRVTGQTVDEFLRCEFAEPLGLDAFTYGVAPNNMARAADNAFTGPPLLPPAKNLLHRALGLSFRDAVTASNDPRFRSSVIPAGNLHTTPAQAARFMQMMLNGGDINGTRIFESRTIQRATAEQSYLEVDLTLGVPVRYGMGFMLGSDHLSVYGRKTSLAYGHMGFTNVVLYADPERDIALSLMTTGKPFVAPGVLRWLGLLQLISRRCPRDWGR